jgi:hypothetical protein
MLHTARLWSIFGGGAGQGIFFAWPDMLRSFTLYFPYLGGGNRLDNPIPPVKVGVRRDTFEPGVPEKR